MKVALVILFAALTIASAKQVAVDAPPAKSTGKIPPEVHRHKRATCGAATKLNSAQAVESINAHNIYRAREPATNMRKAVWNDAMASRAQEWANQCIWAHGMLDDCDGNRIGQNLFVEANPSAYPTMNLTAVVEAWWLERSDWDWASSTCAKDKLCGHWTQLVAAQSYQVGCAYNLCPTMSVGGATWKNCLYVACDYTPTGNVIGDPIYEKGTACANCDFDSTGGGYKCENNLCDISLQFVEIVGEDLLMFNRLISRSLRAKCSPATDASCKCAKPLACVNGSWDAGTCSCTCNKGYYGLKCEQSCTCVDTYDQCDALMDYCTQPDYHDFMLESCHKSCTNLCNPPAFCSA